MKLKAFRQLDFELLHYGEYLKIYDYKLENNTYMRVRIIKYQDKIWYHEMISGKTTKIDVLD